MNTKTVGALSVVNVEKKISIFFSKKEDGNMSLTLANKDVAAKNVKKFSRKIKVKFNKRAHIKPEQGARILVLNKRNFDAIKVKGVNHDGVITLCRDITLTMASADCYPVIITDKQGSFISLLHVGRMGVENRIVSNAISIIVRRLEVHPKDILLVVGPGIKKCCYNIDIAIMIKRQATSYYVPRRNIHLVDTCTCCGVEEDDDGEYSFFSHRRSAETGEQEGRFLTAVSFK